MENFVDDTNFCAYCFDKKSPEFHPLTFTHPVYAPITLKFCPVCYVHLTGGDQKAIDIMLERCERIIHHKAMANFGDGANSRLYPS